MLWDLGLRPGTPGHGEELEPLLDEEVRVHLGRDEIHPSGERALRPLLRFYRALADRCRRSSRAAPPARSKGRIEKMSPTAGRVLTEAIRSPGPIPGDNRAAMDGFSVQASVFLGASSTIQFGAANWSGCRRCLPAGTDAVVPLQAEAQTQSKRAIKPASIWACMWQWKRLRPGSSAVKSRVISWEPPSIATSLITPAVGIPTMLVISKL